MKHLQTIFGLLALGVACGLGTGCVPPEPLQINQNQDQDQDAGAQVPFTEVADVVRVSCASGSSCHGASGSTNFTVEGDREATDEQVRAALEDVETVAGVAMVVEGEPGESALYQRTVADGAQLMPPVGGRLPDEDIETIRVWILEGASYE